MYKKLLFIPLFVFSTYQVTKAQMSALVKANNEYKTGIELLNEEKYAAASQQFKLVQNNKFKTTAEKESQAELSILKENSKFYQAVCALALGNDDAES